MTFETYNNKICLNCGTETTELASLRRDNPRILSCCPERKMVSFKEYEEAQSMASDADR